MKKLLTLLSLISIGGAALGVEPWDEDKESEFRKADNFPVAFDEEESLLPPPPPPILRRTGSADYVDADNFWPATGTVVAWPEGTTFELGLDGRFYAVSPTGERTVI